MGEVNAETACQVGHGAVRNVETGCEAGFVAGGVFAGALFERQPLREA